ncbi:WXG100 family type VII secretion target [Paenibacillus sp. JX-17]|uniref:WXG100 family type VII secretion target n=1 Tax=Paenibacillus lacisoli TaxID=3064525 RepID=A0ABT9CHX9_9BACL|nr:WXG100 family type VII secretion target [Paenibacillus sp. JX-17]MDO7908886.1 WXG100 family type VII secretion target [Paenibacillus sp. JX-17]
MTRIQIPKDRIMEAAQLYHHGHNEFTRMLRQLERSMIGLQAQWSGATREHFWGEYLQMMDRMQRTTDQLLSISTELTLIVKLFQDTDEQTVELPILPAASASKPSSNENIGSKLWDFVETAGDQMVNTSQKIVKKVSDTAQEIAEQAVNFAVGVKDEALDIGNNLLETGKALIEHPIDSAVDIAYNATIGTVKDVGSGVAFAWNYAVDHGDARKQVDQFVDGEMKKGNEQGWSNYSGHVVTGLFSQFILRRVGVKGKLGDSDKYKLKKPEDGELFKKRSEGTGNLKDLPSIIERVKEIRSQLPSKLKKSGNVGYAEVDIQGINKKEYFAHSSVNNATDKGVLPGMSLKPPGEPVFKAKKVDPDNARIDTPEAYLRDYDTEYKILNDIASQLGNNKNAKGTINLFTERLTCQSCTDVILDFRREYPNITINVLTNDGKVVK